MATGEPQAGDDRKNTSVRFPTDLHERLTAAAKERELSVNFIVVRAVEDFLDRLIPVEEIKWTR